MTYKPVTNQTLSLASGASSSKSEGVTSHRSSRAGPHQREVWRAKLEKTFLIISDQNLQYHLNRQSPSITPKPSALSPGDLRWIQFTALGREVLWIEGGVDLVEVFQKFRAANMGPYTLALDGIADLTEGSSFSGSTENDGERHPYQCKTYGEFSKAVRSENMQDPVAAYLFTIVMALLPIYFNFKDEVLEDINERSIRYQFSSTFTSSLNTLPDVDPRSEELSTRDSPLQTTLQGRASLTSSKKRREDEYKLARAMRDCWISNTTVPHRGLAMFGSTSFKD
ncbi:MAG: hypothetical protein J3Q66DRAFT_415099 [Benniella sp.]|nr:MAG: hypothetical protein J3Q66DRAFT_415099 [Benniella sp.]